MYKDELNITIRDLSVCKLTFEFHDKKNHFLCDCVFSVQLKTFLIFLFYIFKAHFIQFDIVALLISVISMFDLSLITVSYKFLKYDLLYTCSYTFLLQFKH